MVEPSISLGPRYASGASSGVSLFGVSRTLNSGEDVALHGQTSDEQLTTDQDTTVDQDTDKPSEPEPIQPRFRPRERRRVNISGRAFVPIAEPVHEEDHPDAAGGGVDGTRPAPNPASPNVPAGTGPAEDAQIEGSPRARPGPTSETRLHPPPGPSGTESPVRSSETLDAGSSAPSLAPRRRPRESLSRHGSSITFERRPELVPADVKAAIPKPSALTALLTAKSESTSASNPFSPLYAALIMRASDALKLTLYFPHSESPSKALKIGVKKDLTVEEVIGAGLWAYWEEGREPKIELEADGIDDESTRWNLRIVEDDGEVDEDFPGKGSDAACLEIVVELSLTILGTTISALDRSKGISAFSFGEFAIVKATERQGRQKQTVRQQMWCVKLSRLFLHSHGQSGEARHDCPSALTRTCRAPSIRWTFSARRGASRVASTHPKRCCTRASVIFPGSCRPWILQTANRRRFFEFCRAGLAQGAITTCYGLKHGIDDRGTQ